MNEGPVCCSGIGEPNGNEELKPSQARCSKRIKCSFKDEGEGRPSNTFANNLCQRICQLDRSYYRAIRAAYISERYRCHSTLQLWLNGGCSIPANSTV